MTETASTQSTATIEADLSGRQVGDYRILRRLGRGGMAEVYLAEQLSLRRQVALKVLRKNLANDDKYVKRFHAEAQSAAALVHANIVQIHEVGCVEGVHYIAQEYVQGHNLREYLTRDGLPDLKLAVKVMCSVAAALHRAAERGIVHRDIKPENIMLAKSGEVKVADFGLARRTQEDALNLTQIGQTMGTPLYMSPEQVEGKALDPRSDIYSLGVTCYHMLTGHPPFRGDTALSVAVQHLKNQPERVENQRPDLPPNLCRIVHKMLAKEPGSRYPSARELLRELRALRAELNGDGAMDDTDDESLDAADIELAGRSRAAHRLDTLMKTSMLRRTRRRRVWLWALAGMAAFALGGAYAWTTRPPSLLAGAAVGEAPIRMYPTAEEQEVYASLVKTVEGWNAILQHHPNDRYYTNVARRELGMLYLQQGAEDKALQQFDQLAGLRDNTDAEFRAFGLAGQAVSLSMKEAHAKSNAKVAELFPMMDKLDQRMLQIVRDVVRENDLVLKRQTDEQWEKLFLERLPQISPQPMPDSG